MFHKLKKNLELKENRVTDHRIGFTIQKLDRVMEGELQEIIDALINEEQKEKLEAEM